ncbi:MAG: alpha/beta hydrolase [Sphingomicrobium sp.]
MTRRFALLSALSGSALFGCSPAALLNGVSRLAGDSARLAAGGVRFGDDPRLKLDVWVPPRPAAAPSPVVLFFYGGGWVAGERGDYGFVGRALASLGFVTVIPDYRLVPQVRFPVFVEDGAKAVKWTLDHIARFGGDPRRIALSGHSAGSYIAAMLALDRHYLADAGMDPAIVRAAALLSGPYDFYPFTEQRGRDALGNWPRPLETQPISFVRRDAPPMLLMQGTADTIVQPRNSRRLAAALTSAGATVELKLYPGKSHIDTVKSLSPLFRGSTSALADTTAFLRAYDRSPAGAA